MSKIPKKPSPANYGMEAFKIVKLEASNTCQRLAFAIDSLLTPKTVEANLGKIAKAEQLGREILKMLEKRIADTAREDKLFKRN